MTTYTIQDLITNDPAKLQTILDSGFWVDTSDEDGKTALHWAAEQGNGDAVKLLLAADADYLACDCDNITPLMYAAWNKHPDAFQALIEAGSLVDAVNDCEETALLWAARAGNTEHIALLAHAGANMNPQADEFGNTPLMESVSNPDAMTLLLNGGADPTFKDRDGTSVLVEAIRKNSPESVAILIQRGASVEEPNQQGKTPLMLAACAGRPATVKVLLDAGATVEPADNDGGTALHWGARGGSADVARLLLDRGADPTIVNRKGETPEAVAKADSGAQTVLRTVSERQMLRDVFGSANDQEPVQRHRKM